MKMLTIIMGDKAYQVKLKNEGQYVYLEVLTVDQSQTLWAETIIFPSQNSAFDYTHEFPKRFGEQIVKRYLRYVKKAE